MEIRIKEPLYICHNGQEYIVRQGTVGIERKKIVYFYDVTRTASVGYARDFCLEHPQIFQVSRNLTDREVSLKDVIQALDSVELPSDSKNKLIDIINTL